MTVRGLLLDLAGVVHEGDRLLPGAAEALDRLRSLGLPFRYVTNTSRRTRDALVDRLRGLGVAAEPGDIYTAPIAARDWLTRRSLRPHLLIHPELAPEFDGVSQDAPNAVFVADAAEGFEYGALNAAFRVLRDGAPLVAVGRNRYFRERGQLYLDAGPFIAALEYAAGVEAVVIGKPAADFFLAAVADLGLAPETVLMIGDDVEADVLGARAAGLEAALVRTGKFEPADEARLAGSGAVCYENLLELIDCLTAT